jgi:hypothetical protein
LWTSKFAVRSEYGDEIPGSLKEGQVPKWGLTLLFLKKNFPPSS